VVSGKAAVGGGGVQQPRVEVDQGAAQPATGHARAAAEDRHPGAGRQVSGAAVQFGPHLEVRDFVGPFEQVTVGVLGGPHVAVVVGEQCPEQLDGGVGVRQKDVQRVAFGAGHAGGGVTLVRVLYRPRPDVGDQRHAAAVQAVTQFHVLAAPFAEPLIEAPDRGEVVRLL